MTLFLITSFFECKITMKAILFMLVAIVATTILLDASASLPFEISETGVNIESYQFDAKMNSIILEVEVSDSEGTLEMTFDREFFDAIYQGQDDEFLVIADGDLLAYEETKTTQSRTITLNLISDVDEVLMVRSVDDNNIISEIQEQNVQLLDEKELLTKQVSVLSTEIENMKVQENLLQDENEKLGKKIFAPDNLMKETEAQANNFSSAVMEQINAFTTWVNSFF